MSLQWFASGHESSCVPEGLFALELQPSYHQNCLGLDQNIIISRASVLLWLETGNDVGSLSSASEPSSIHLALFEDFQSLDEECLTQTSGCDRFVSAGCLRHRKIAHLHQGQLAPYANSGFRFVAILFAGMYLQIGPLYLSWLLDKETCRSMQSLFAGIRYLYVHRSQMCTLYSAPT